MGESNHAVATNPIPFLADHKPIFGIVICGDTAQNIWNEVEDQRLIASVFFIPDCRSALRNEN